MKLKSFKGNKFSIVEDGMSSTPLWGEGRLMPIVVLNEAQDKDGRLLELLAIHQDTNGGDVITSWGIQTKSILRRDKILLHIEFVKPVEYIFLIEFILNKDYGLIDAIRQSNSLQIFSGKKGDKVSKKMKEGRSNFILLEVTNDESTKDWWEKLLRMTIAKRLRKLKVPKSKIKSEVQNQINHIREILNIRRRIE